MAEKLNVPVLDVASETECLRHIVDEARYLIETSQRILVLADRGRGQQVWGGRGRFTGNTALPEELAEMRFFCWV